MTAYDPDNIFAKILRDEIPSETVYEDENARVIMDIMPRTAGHALVLPKAPSRNILDIAPDDLANLMATVQKVAQASMKAFEAGGLVIEMFTEEPGGQTVFHTHVHVIPRHEGQPLRAHAGGMAEPEELKANAEKLRAALNEV
jgi:histidine triad (HIT) family protein